MKKLITLTLLLVLSNAKAQQDPFTDWSESLPDTLPYTQGQQWSNQLDSLLLVIDRKLYTEYYTLEGKQTPLVYNTPLLAYYRGERKKVIIFN